MSYLPLKENNKEGKKSMHRQSFSFLKKTLFLTLIRPGKEGMDTSENLDDQSWGIELNWGLIPRYIVIIIFGF